LAAPVVHLVAEAVVLFYNNLLLWADQVEAVLYELFGD
jgi:hypothetical protein